MTATLFYLIIGAGFITLSIVAFYWALYCKKAVNTYERASNHQARRESYANLLALGGLEKAQQKRVTLNAFGAIAMVSGVIALAIGISKILNP